MVQAIVSKQEGLLIERGNNVIRTGCECKVYMK